MRKLLVIGAMAVAMFTGANTASAALPTKSPTAPRTTWVAEQGSGGCYCSIVFYPIRFECHGGRLYVYGILINTRNGDITETVMHVGNC